MQQHKRQEIRHIRGVLVFEDLRGGLARPVTILDRPSNTVALERQGGRQPILSWSKRVNLAPRSMGGRAKLE